MVEKIVLFKYKYEIDEFCDDKVKIIQNEGNFIMDKIRHNKNKEFYERIRNIQVEKNYIYLYINNFYDNMYLSTQLLVMFLVENLLHKYNLNIKINYYESDSDDE